MFTEHIDLMPTLAQAAMGVIVPPCPRGAAILTTEYCTMGTSLVPLMTAPATPVRAASFSQYPRGYQPPPNVDADLEGQAALPQVGAGKASPSACLTKKCTMGYSVVSLHQGREYRYTEWVDFEAMANVGPWRRVVGVELYDHEADMQENYNMASHATSQEVVKALSAQLHLGPTTGGGWGAWQE